LGIRWALLDEDATGGAAEPPDDPDFEWNTAEHEAKQKVAYMEALEGAVRDNMCCFVLMRPCCSVAAACSCMQPTIRQVAHV
jgi:hypothetical protein